MPADNIRTRSKEKYAALVTPIKECLRRKHEEIAGWIGSTLPPDESPKDATDFIAHASLI
jgi:hypothetical protein